MKNAPLIKHLHSKQAQIDLITLIRIHYFRPIDYRFEYEPARLAFSILVHDRHSTVDDKYNSFKNPLHYYKVH